MGPVRHGLERANPLITPKESVEKAFLVRFVLHGISLCSETRLELEQVLEDADIAQVPILC